MDFLRSRAIPALIALLAAGGAHAACEGLAGTYKVEATALVDGRPRHLDDFSIGRGHDKLVKSEGSTQQRDLASGRPINRGKITYVATNATLDPARRKPTFEFHDASGKTLATMDIGDGWRCTGDKLEREAERTAGLGDDIRTDRVQETFARAGDALVYTEIATTIDPPGRKPKRTEIRFAAAK